jgi:hypothetical protein
VATGAGASVATGAGACVAAGAHALRTITKMIIRNISFFMFFFSP